MRLVAGSPPRRPGFDHRSGHVEFVADKVALGQVFSEYFGFPCQFSFHHTHLPTGADTIGPVAADVPSGLGLTPSHEELIVYFPRYDTGHTENDASNNSSIVA
jgi:hypothetical protein